MMASLRYQMFLLTAALLYLGPLVAGLAGLRWQMIPVFSAVFLLWLLILRPALWPDQLRDWVNPRLLSQLMLSILVQMALILLCFGIGRGIGATMGTLAAVPVWVPPLMSFLAIPLARICWTPDAPAPGMPGMPDYSDRARVRASAADRAGQAGLAANLAYADQSYAQACADCDPWIQQLSLLTARDPDTAILTILSEARQITDPLALLDRLAEPGAKSAVNPVLRRAFILLATEPDVSGRIQGLGQLTRAFEMAGEDAGRLRLYAERMRAVLAVRRTVLLDTPAIARIRDVATRHPSASASLRALTEQMARLNDA